LPRYCLLRYIESLLTSRPMVHESSSGCAKWASERFRWSDAERRGYPVLRLRSISEMPIPVQRSSFVNTWPSLAIYPAFAALSSGLPVFSRAIRSLRRQLQEPLRSHPTSRRSNRLRYFRWIECCASFQDAQHPSQLAHKSARCSGLTLARVSRAARQSHPSRFLPRKKGSSLSRHELKG
jgi:hypothetical protein